MKNQTDETFHPVLESIVVNLACQKSMNEKEAKSVCHKLNLDYVRKRQNSKFSPTQFQKKYIKDWFNK